MKFLNVPLFIISLAIGLFFCYISTAPHNVILVYPTPDNENKLLYKDDSETCYRFQSTQIDCPKDTSLNNKIPVQKGIIK